MEVYIDINIKSKALIRMDIIKNPDSHIWQLKPTKPFKK